MAVLYRLNARSEDYEEAFALADPVPGARRGVHPPARRAAHTVRLLRGRETGRRSARSRRSCAARGWIASLAGRPRRGRADAPGRPRSAPVAGGAAPRRRDGGGLPPRPRGALRRREPGPWRPPAHVPPRQGLPSGRRSSSRAWRRKELPVARPAARSAWPRSAASSTSASRARSVADADVDGRREAESVPGRAGRGRPGACEGAEAGAHPGVRGSTPLASRAREGRRGVPAYVVFHDSTLHEIAAVRPATQRS